MKSAIAGKKNIAIVCNPKAGKGRSVKILQMIIPQLKNRHLSYQLFKEEWPAGFLDFGEVWLIGGDGTLNYFINQYPDLSIPIALFKGGSGNDFAWKLYGNLSPQQYLERVFERKIKRSDAGICNSRYFINGVGIGFDGEIVKAMGSKKIIAGHIAYLVTVLKNIFSFREKEMKINTGGFNSTNKIFMISITNGSRFGGGFLVAPQAIIDDGKLDIVIIDAISPLKRLFNLHKMEKGRHLQLPFVKVLKGQKIIVRSDNLLAGHLDGEEMQSDKFEIEILSRQFSFIG